MRAERIGTANSFSSALIVAAALAAGDQLTKFLISQLDQPVGFAGFSLGRVLNQSGVFGLDLSNNTLIAVGIVVCAILAAVVLTSDRTPAVQAGLWLVLFGAASNLIDRITAGGVVDIIGIEGVSRFNLADAMIILGALALVIGLLRPNYQPNR